MKKTEVEQFIVTFNQMRTLYDEIFSLSGRKPNDSINTFKLNLFNRVLASSNLILGESKPFPDFTLFDESAMPSNSDVAVMLSQYLDSMERFRSKNIREDYNQEWIWIIDEDEKIETYRPRTRYQRVK